ncbi:right-handed parallel beta-helix repeat-containing protein, partial [bacterium]|nr:right-handed parallel beta-helix repeat-containing protein [bacterium]
TNCTINSNSIDAVGSGGGIACDSDTSAIFTGCTINNNSAYGFGGGVYCSGSSPSFVDCQINGNNAHDGWNVHGIGGGVFCSGASPTFTNCTINGNSSDSTGGGVACSGGSSATFDNCTMNSNHAEHSGGGMHCFESSPTFNDCSINNNSSLEGGGVYCSESSASFTSCTVNGNSVDMFGGGISCFNSSPSFTNCTIRANTVTDSFWEGSGGGVACYNSSPTFSLCTIADNSAVGGYSGGGGGVFCFLSSPTFINCRLDHNSTEGGVGGGVLCVEYSAPIFSNCVISSNLATQGGGLSCQGASASFMNCTFSGNSNWAIECWYCSLTVNSTVIAFSEELGIFFGNNTVSHIEYCNLFGNSGNAFGGDVPHELGEPITTNINGDSCDTYYNILLDPMFVDTAAGDYHLLAGSPCIDAGNPELPYDPDGTIADIGAFYYHQAATEIPVALLPASHALHPNFPNPFNPTTMIRYDVKHTGPVRLTIFNLLGQKVTTLVNTRQLAGSYMISWNASDLPSGMYLCRMETSDFTQTRKLVLLK